MIRVERARGATPARATWLRSPIADVTVPPYGEQRSRPRIRRRRRRRADHERRARHARAESAVELVGLDLDRIEIDRLQAARPDLLLSAAHRRIIRPPELAIARAGSVGLHPSLFTSLPRLASALVAIRNHETEAG